MPSQDSRSEETRKKLIRAARDVVVEKGWSAVTNRAIAERAGVNLALINYHFGGQKNLCHAMLDASVAQIGMDFAPQDAGGDLSTFVSQAIAIVPRMVDDPNVKVLAGAMLEATFDEQLAAVVRRNLESLRALVRSVVIANGAESRAADGLVTLLAALMDGIMLHLLIDPDTDISAAAEAAGRIDWNA